MQYTTKDGERLDIICARHYGSVNNTFEQVVYDHANADLTTAEFSLQARLSRCQSSRRQRTKLKSSYGNEL